MDKLKYLLEHFTGKKAIAMESTIVGIWTAMPDTVDPNVKAVLTVVASCVLIWMWSNEDVATTNGNASLGLPPSSQIQK